MYPDWVWLLSGAVFIWIGILTFLIWQQNNFLRSIFPKNGERDIRRRFEELVKEIEGFRKGLEVLTGRLSEVENQSIKHIQRVELLRFNPYGDTGGDQSFTLALLDHQGTGLVVTCLHARSGTRIFAKPILEGKSHKYKLSSEEEETVRKAMER